MDGITQNILTIIGVIVGALLHFIFTRQNEANKHLQQLRVIAYGDFIKSISAIAHAQKNQEHLATLADSKARICLYGHQKVIDAISDFIKHHNDLKSREAQLSFILILKEMRKDNLKAYDVSDNNFSQLLFSLDITTK
jgi:predicted negative regulator of RcsB-dependent stress response